MSKIYEFLTDNLPFFLLTSANNQPLGRPFGAIYEQEDKLFVATSNEKQVYSQIKSNPKISLIAIKTGTREWLRVNGVAKECVDLKIKAKMLEACPVLQKHYPSADYERFNVFEISVSSYEFK